VEGLLEPQKLHEAPPLANTKVENYGAILLESTCQMVDDAKDILLDLAPPRAMRHDRGKAS
jgi:hypothetical protein